MNFLIKASICLLLLNACSDNSQHLKQEVVEKDYLEKYYELEEVEYEEKLSKMAG